MKTNNEISQDPLLLNRLLIGFIEALSTLLPKEKWPADDESKAEDDEPLDVAIGDVVYYFSEDEGAIVNCPVVAKHENHFYCVSSANGKHPKLEAVSKGWFYLTAKEAAVAAKDDIEFSLQYHSEQLQGSQAAANLISGKSTRVNRKKVKA